MPSVGEFFSSFKNINVGVGTLGFVIFALIVTTCYYLVPKKVRWCVLLTASTLFYLFAGVQYSIYIISTILISYFAARIIDKLHSNQKEAIKNVKDKEKKKKIKEEFTKKRKLVLILSLVVVIGELAILKYTGFALENINAMFSVFGLSQTKIYQLAVPLGCSFYTFMIVSYLVDIYRKKYAAQANFAKYALYVSYFPHIRQGPIDRYDYLAPQLYEGHSFNFENYKSGAILVLWGFFKKLIIADQLALVTNSVFKDYTKHNGLIVLIAAVLYSIQIYADWTGYCDMVGGVSEMMGIKISKNFARPYFSQTMPEFWRRWHISLSVWFKDYVLYPISASKFSLKLNKSSRSIFGNNAGRIISSFLPIMSVWFLTGLWHGATWSYILWGVFHGLVIMLSLIFEKFNEKIIKLFNIRTDNFSFKLFRILRTFFICVVGRLIFMAGSFAASIKIVPYALNYTEWAYKIKPIYEFGIDKKDFKIIIYACIAFLIVSVIQENLEGKGIGVRQALQKQNIWFRWIILFALIFAIIIYGQYGQNVEYTPSVYEQFQ